MMLIPGLRGKKRKRVREGRREDRGSLLISIHFQLVPSKCITYSFAN